MSIEFEKWKKPNLRKQMEALIKDRPSLQIQRKRVLVVDDSSAMRKQVVHILKEINIEVVEAANQSGMFEKIEKEGRLVDLIILDVILEEEDGRDLLKSLRKHPRYKDIPVIILTNHSERRMVIELLKHKVNSYVLKPIHREDLKKRVMPILGIEDTSYD